MDEFGFVQQVFKGLKQLGGQGLTAVCQETCHGLSFQVLPEPFDGIEVRTVGGLVEGFDVMPVKPGAFVPAGVVEHQMDLFAFLGGHFFGHGIEEGLKDFGVAVGDDLADELAAGDPFSLAILEGRELP